jgi:hypothetical protein
MAWLAGLAVEGCVTMRYDRYRQYGYARLLVAARVFGTIYFAIKGHWLLALLV